MKKSQPEQRIQEWYKTYLESFGLLFCASCGGMRTSLGTAVKMKKAGYKKGFPDLQICEPRGKYHGLFVELKSKTGSASKYQKEWRKCLNDRGYYAVSMPRGLEYREAQKWLEQETINYLNQ